MGMPAADSAAAGADIDLRLVHGAGQRVGVAGVVGEKIDVHIEGDEKSFIFRAQNAAEKSSAGLLLQRQNILLASAGVEQDSQGEGLIVLGGEVLDLLRRLVFQDGEVILGEMGNERAVLVVHGEVKAHQVDVDLEGLERLLLVVLVGVSGGSLGRGVGGRRNLGHAHARRQRTARRTARRPTNAEDENSWRLDGGTWRTIPRNEQDRALQRRQRVW